MIQHLELGFWFRVNDFVFFFKRAEAKKITPPPPDSFEEDFQGFISLISYYIFLEPNNISNFQRWQSQQRENAQTIVLWEE